MNTDHQREVPPGRTMPNHPRKRGGKSVDRLREGLRSTGSICLPAVRRLGDHYEVLDGHLRCNILREIPVKSICCLIVSQNPGEKP